MENIKFKDTINSIGNHINFKDVSKELKYKDEYNSFADNIYVECRHFNLSDETNLHAYEITYIQSDDNSKLSSAYRTLYLTPYYNESMFNFYMDNPISYEQDFKSYLNNNQVEHPAYIEYKKDTTPNGTHKATLNLGINDLSITNVELAGNDDPMARLKHMVMNTTLDNFTKESYLKEIDKLDNSIDVESKKSIYRTFNY